MHSGATLTRSYPLPPACEDIEILRVVVRESFGGDLVRKLITDIITVTEELLAGDGPSVAMQAAGAAAPPTAKKSLKHISRKHKHRPDELDEEKIRANTNSHSQVC